MKSYHQLVAELAVIHIATRGEGNKAAALEAMLHMPEFLCFVFEVCKIDLKLFLTNKEIFAGIRELIEYF